MLLLTTLRRPEALGFTPTQTSHVNNRLTLQCSGLMAMEGAKPTTSRARKCTQVIGGRSLFFYQYDISTGEVKYQFHELILTEAALSLFITGSKWACEPRR